MADPLQVQPNAMSLIKRVASIADLKNREPLQAARRVYYLII
jgi:hypothetical protein